MDENNKKKKQNTIFGRILQLGIPLVFGVIISIVPTDFSGLAVVVGMYMYFFIHKKYPFWPLGAALGLLLFISVIIIADNMPKYEDQKFGPFPSTTISLQYLNENQIIIIHGLETFKNPILIELPNRSISRREIFKIIEEQTTLKKNGFMCGNGRSILYGSPSKPWIYVYDILKFYDSNTVSDTFEILVDEELGLYIFNKKIPK